MTKWAAPLLAGLFISVLQAQDWHVRGGLQVPQGARISLEREFDFASAQVGLESNWLLNGSFLEMQLFHPKTPSVRFNLGWQRNIISRQGQKLLYKEVNPYWQRVVGLGAMPLAPADFRIAINGPTLGIEFHFKVLKQNAQLGLGFTRYDLEVFLGQAFQTAYEKSREIELELNDEGLILRDLDFVLRDVQEQIPSQLHRSFYKKLPGVPYLRFGIQIPIGRQKKE